MAFERLSRDAVALPVPFRLGGSVDIHSVGKSLLAALVESLAGTGELLTRFPTTTAL